MKIKDIMNSEPETISPSTTVKDAAAMMAKDGVGFLLVGEGDRLKGTITDRDIVVRAVCKGVDVAKTTIGDILMEKILYCREDQDVEDVARNMSEQKVRRMPVVNSEKRLVGVVSIGDLAQHLSKEVVGDVLRSVTSERQAA